ncbi:MAG: CsgG/HfaB family protein [Pseudomonadota bacterium]
MSIFGKLIGGVALASLLAACQGGQVTQGTSGTAISGSAGGSTTVDANAGLERCAETLGTLAVDDGRDKAWYGYWYRTTGVTSVEPMIRLAAQQSNCFVITSLGNERLEGKIQGITDKQRNSGEFRAGSNQQLGQRVAADYFLEPAIIINNADSGALGAGVGALLGGVAGAVAGSLRTSDSVVTLSLFDIRSGVQLAAAEGSSTATNYGAALGAFGGPAGGALGGYSRTPEGKATVAAFVDAFNNLVRATRNYQAQNVRGGLGTGGTLTVN